MSKETTSLEDQYISLLNDPKGLFQQIENVVDRRKAVCTKLGIDYDQLQTRFATKDFQVKVFRHLSFKVANNKYTLLVSREELLLETLQELREKLVTTTDEDKRLKAIKLKGELDVLCERLVDGIEKLYKEIYGDVAQVAKEEVRKSLSPEQRIKGRG